MNQKQNTKIIIMSGATATGKTDAAIKTYYFLKEQNIKSSIVNFDSLLFYTELNIGTAKPTKEELNIIPHSMINISSITKPINAADYITQAELIIENLHDNNEVIILTGGSGFYLRALIKGMYSGTPTSSIIRTKVNQMYKDGGIESISNILKKEDPESLISIHKNDHYRRIRAVEFFLSTGKKISDQKKIMEKQNPYDLTKEDWDIMHIYLDIPKNTHQQIIEQRTVNMINNGLIKEVQNLLNINNEYKNLKPMKSIGYKEVIQYLNGEIPSESKCIERIVISTRQLAKAQRTWFNKILNKNRYNYLTDMDNITKDIFDFLS